MLGNLSHTVIYGLTCSLLYTFDEATLGDSEVTSSFVGVQFVLHTRHEQLNMQFILLSGPVRLGSCFAEATISCGRLLANGEGVLLHIDL